KQAIEQLYRLTDPNSQFCRTLSGNKILRGRLAELRAEVNADGLRDLVLGAAIETQNPLALARTVIQLRAGLQRLDLSRLKETTRGHNKPQAIRTLGDVSARLNEISSLSTT